MATYSRQDLAGLQNFAHNFGQFINQGGPNYDPSCKKAWALISGNLGRGTFGSAFNVALGHQYAGDPLRTLLSTLCYFTAAAAQGAAVAGGTKPTIASVRTAFNTFVAKLNATRPSAVTSAPPMHKVMQHREVVQTVQHFQRQMPQAMPRQPMPASVPSIYRQSAPAPQPMPMPSPAPAPQGVGTGLAGGGIAPQAWQIAKMATSQDPTIGAKGNAILKKMRFLASRGDSGAQSDLAQCRAALDKLGVDNDAF